MFAINEKVKKIENCIACNSKELQLVLDLNEQPLANSYRDFGDQIEEFFPLAINVCTNCFHTQLTHKVNPDLLFKNYLYVSGTSVTQKEYFKWFANFSSEYVGNFSSKNVLDIGCNDGSQLDAFKDIGWNTMGIDPAENLKELSSKNHNVICDYFSDHHVNLGIFDIIICQNAFAHNYDQYKFLINAKKMMSDNSLLFIATSQVDMILHGEFDTIYHEHLSFYTIKSMNALCNRVGLNLIDVVKNSIHGNSYIFVISKNKNRKFYIENLISYEKNSLLHDLSTYRKYSESCKRNAYELNKFIKTIQNFSGDNRPRVIGLGAPAKGNTLMNFMKNGPDFIIDENPLKQNKFVPGLNIQIHEMAYLQKYKDAESLIFIPLAWNFYDEIVNKIKAIRNDKTDVFVKYFPKLQLDGWEKFVNLSPVAWHPV